MIIKFVVVMFTLNYTILPPFYVVQNLPAIFITFYSSQDSCPVKSALTGSRRSPKQFLLF